MLVAPHVFSTPPAFVASEVVRIDAVTVLLAALVGLVALAVLPYAHRSLRGDRHGTGVTAALALVFAASATLVLLAPLAAQAAAWSLATLGVLIALYLGGGSAATRRPAAWLLASDACLWAAVILGPGVPGAVLLVMAAGIRAASFSAHGWLLDALRAPTPVSAALHGGVVNGGAIVLLLQLPTFSGGAAPLVVAAAIGSVAIVVGAAGLAVRTDIKGKLVLSTVAQLGFTLLCIGLGLTAAALLHLVAHGWYKSARFLGSGDGVDQRARDRRAPATARLVAPRVGAVAGAVVAVAAVTGGVLLSYPGAASLGGAAVVLMIGMALGSLAARLAGAATSRAQLVGRLATIAGLAAVAALALGALTGILVPALGEPLATPKASIALAALAAIALAALAVLRRAGRGSALERGVLAAALALGAAPRTSARTTAPPPGDSPATHRPVSSPSHAVQEVAA